MDLDDDRLGLLLVRVSELRSKIANCIARENSAAGEEKVEIDGEKDTSNATVEGYEESENLLAICEAFDSLECQLGSLQALQQQQEYQRADAMAEIERSRKQLLKKLTEYEGEHLDLIKEASAFAGLKVDNTNELLLPPYTSLDNGHVPLLSYGYKLPQNIHGGTNGINGSKNEIVQSENVKSSQTFLSRSWTGLRFLVGSAAKTMVTIVAVVSVLKMAGFEPRLVLVKKGCSEIKLGGLFQQIVATEEKRAASSGCPPGKVAVVEDGETRCIVKERIEIPFDKLNSSPDVDYGCG